MKVSDKRLAARSSRRTAGGKSLTRGIPVSAQEREEAKARYYAEAMRYMDNAKECLAKAKKEDIYYVDPKYVKMACGTAYSGLLLALDGLFELQGIPKPSLKQRKSVEYYQSNIAQMDRKMLNQLNSAYEVLHLWGYYDGVKRVSIIKDGFDDAYRLIEKIKPANGVRA